MKYTYTYMERDIHTYIYTRVYMRDIYICRYMYMHARDIQTQIHIYMEREKETEFCFHVALQHNQKI